MTTTDVKVTTIAPYGLVGIETYYLSPTNSRGGRIKGRRTDHKAGDKTVTMSYDYGLSPYDNHRFVAAALIDHYGWHGEYFAAATDRGYVFARKVEG